jgi:hypothetical protein
MLEIQDHTCCVAQALYFSRVTQLHTMMVMTMIDKADNCRMSLSMSYRLGLKPSLLKSLLIDSAKCKIPTAHLNNQSHLGIERQWQRGGHNVSQALWIMKKWQW